MLNWRNGNLHTYCNILWHRASTPLLHAFEAWLGSDLSNHFPPDSRVQLATVEAISSSLKSWLRSSSETGSTRTRVCWFVLPTTIQHQALFLFECGKWWIFVVRLDFEGPNSTHVPIIFPPSYHPTPFLGEFTRCELHLCILHSLGHHLSRFLCCLGAQHRPGGAIMRTM